MKRRNLIVTCGTSQITQERLDAMHVGEPEFAKQLRRSDRRVVAESARSQGLESPLIEYLQLEKKEAGQPTRINLYYEEILNQLNMYTQSLKEGPNAPVNFEKYFKDKMPDQVELLGAELATLAVMRFTTEEGEERESFLPDQDRVTILWSDTLAGAFCASIVREFLIKKWIPDSDRLGSVRVQGLMENPKNPESVDQNILNALDRVLEQVTNIDQHVLVYSGGFKSTIPMMTWFGYLHGINLCCLFEDSTILRCTVPSPNPQGALRQVSYRAGKLISNTPVVDSIGDDA